MRERRFGRIVNITSAMDKSPRPHMALSTTARTALTALAKAMSLEAAADNVTINNLLPERIDTPRQQFMAERMMKAEGIDLTEARRRITQSIAARRMGTPQEFGDACDAGTEIAGPRRWLLVGCVPPLTRHASQWVSDEALQERRQRWLDDTVATRARCWSATVAPSRR